MGFYGDFMVFNGINGISWWFDGINMGFLWILSGSWEMLMGYDGILWNPMVDGTHLKTHDSMVSLMCD